MQCVQCEGIENEFSKKQARGDLKSYRKNGPHKTAQILIDYLKKQGVQGLTLLDIGGGVGVIQHELLEAGIKSSTGVDASSAYIESAREEAEKRGLAGQALQIKGDFVKLAPEVPQADIVTLDRVICCYDDMAALVENAADHAKKFLALVYPRDHVFTKVFVFLGNLFLRLKRSQFRAFVHETKVVDRLIRDSGLTPHFDKKTMFWQVVAYTR